MKGKDSKGSHSFFLAFLKNRALPATYSRFGRFTGLSHGCKLDD